MKIGVLSDTHLSRASGLLKSCWQRFSNTRTFDDLHTLLQRHFQDVDLIVHAGDFVDVSVLEMLQEFKPVEAVYGNMDSGDICTKLPEKRVLDVEGRKIGITHGSGAPQGIVARVSSQFSGEQVDAIIFGHSHQPLTETQNGILFFNPGSPTDRIFAPYNSLGILEVAEAHIMGKIIRV
jgi:putative phosphoesterase